jgi:putative transposase
MDFTNIALMSERYKIHDQQGIYFITCTAIAWVDIFTRQRYKDVIIESLNFCIEKKELKVHGWVLMTNHLHLIISAVGKIPLVDIIRDFKKYTSGKIKSLLKKEDGESRREWMLSIFTLAGTDNPNNKDFQLWKSDNRPIELYTFDVMKQKLQYIHNNPVKAGFVAMPEHWLYSSAGAYMNMESIIKIDFLL